MNYRKPRLEPGFNERREPMSVLSVEAAPMRKEPDGFWLGVLMFFLFRSHWR